MKFDFTDDEIRSVGWILTQFVETRGGSTEAHFADQVLKKMGKDIGRIYRKEAKKFELDISKVRR